MVAFARTSGFDWSDGAMYLRKLTISVTTDAGGDGVGYSERFSGVVRKILYTKVDFADGVDIDVTAEATGEILWSQDDVNASTEKSPVEKAQIASTGLNSTLVEQPLALVGDRLVVTVAQGGNVKSGTFTVIVG